MFTDEQPGYLGYGMMAGFNRFTDLGLNTNDPNLVGKIFHDET